MKFEMEFGWLQNSKITIETNDFEIINVFEEFVRFQEAYGWVVDYVAVEDEFDDAFDDEDDTEEKIDGDIAEAAEEAADKE
jgi:hypothetical protein